MQPKWILSFEMDEVPLESGTVTGLSVMKGEASASLFLF